MFWGFIAIMEPESYFVKPLTVKPLLFAFIPSFPITYYFIRT